MVDSLKSTIMARDDLSSKEADELIQEAKDAVSEGEDPEEVLYDFFGLEPDYIFDLM